MRFYSHTQGLSLIAPLAEAESVDVSASDWSDPNKLHPRAISVGASGDVKVDLVSGDTITFYAIAGTIYPVMFTKVYQTGTTATSIVVWA